MEEEVESVRRQAREDVARAKEEADMSVEEERSRALKEVRGFPRIVAYCVCVGGGTYRTRHKIPHPLDRWSNLDHSTAKMMYN